MNLAVTFFAVLALIWPAFSQSEPETPLKEALPIPSPAEQSQVIEAARGRANRYLDQLPNFICTQTIRRQVLRRGAKTWKANDTLVLDLAFVDRSEQHTLRTINGKSTKQDFDEIGGVISNGEFGSILDFVFQDSAQALLRWERWSNLRGRAAHVVSYRVEKANSGYHMDFATDKGKVESQFAINGLVYIDRETSEVMRINVRPEGIPTDWPIRGAVSEVDYDYAEIAGQRWLLPLHANATLIMQDGSQHRNTINFSTFRKCPHAFESAEI